MSEINEKYVNILMSTYNGEDFILEQLNSLYSQTYPFIRIYVRDDGSSDSTYKILSDEQSKGRIILFPQGDNLGPANSFFKLLDSSENADFFAFCDQDDLWNVDKVERAVATIREIAEDEPAMYFSSVECVDEKNKLIKLIAPSKDIGFGNALVENIAIGCTMVLNKSARVLIAKDPPSNCLMHDSWCYLVVSCFGIVLYDPLPSMRYRQHSNNVFGAPSSAIDSLVRRIKRFSFSQYGVFRFGDQAAIMSSIYGNDIPDKQKAILNLIVTGKYSIFHRLRLAMSKHIWRQNIIDNFILRILILVNRY